MKNFFLIILIAVVVSSCSTLKQAGQTSAASRPGEKKQPSIEFIENISINPDNSAIALSREPASTTGKKELHNQPLHISFAAPIENYSPLQFKYAILENADVEELGNARLLKFMEDWYGAKYRFGGAGRDGIDCSAFVSTLMSVVYGVNNMPRMSKDQFKATERIKKSELQEGDLVFFHTYGRKRKTITHVGVYLRNSKFIHASVAGVMISDMSEGYYAAHFVGAGRAVDDSIRDAVSTN
ncbi:MAG: C40 family peptidase [Bacteroidetes bacterium]|nr:C40 family peptidase [Bacteroidota bacterium]MBS1973914.1 C40 family peptidase [Bacteroidota bacterium]